MNATDILNMTLDEVVEHGYPHFTYEIDAESSPLFKYEFEYLMRGYRSGDPEGYDVGHVDVPEYARVSAFYDDVLFAYGDIEFDPEAYELDYVAEDPYNCAAEYAEYAMVRYNEEGLFPDNVLSVILSDPELVSDYYDDMCSGGTTIRELLAQSETFVATE